MIGAILAKRGLVGAFEAMNRHDLSEFTSGWRDDAVFVFPGDIPESGTFEGKSAVEGWFRRFFERFPTIRYEIQNICLRNGLDLFGNNVAAVEWNTELTNREGETFKSSGITVVTIQGGKVLEVKDYYFDLGDEFRRAWGA